MGLASQNPGRGAVSRVAREVIAARLAKIEQGEGEFLSIAQLKE